MSAPSVLSSAAGPRCLCRTAGICLRARGWLAVLLRAQAAADSLVLVLLRAVVV